MARKKTSSVPGSINFWRFARDVVFQTMNRGLFLPLLLFLIIALYFYRYPAQELPYLTDKFILGLKEWWLVGYLLFIFTIVVWGVHSKLQRRTIADELKRISKERDKLQELQLGRKLIKSSEEQ